MTPVATFIDAGILIYACRPMNPILCGLARAVLGDSGRTFFTNPLVILECLPKEQHFKFEQNVKFMEGYFKMATEIPINDALLTQARVLAAETGIGGVDALHRATAIEAGCGEFITNEKKSAGIFRAAQAVLKSDGLLLVSIHDSVPS